jgi:hypothetical protein
MFETDPGLRISARLVMLKLRRSFTVFRRVGVTRPLR